MITISEKIKSILPNLKLASIIADVVFQQYNQNLWNEIDEEIKRIEKINIEEIKNIEAINSSRQAYLALGKEPSRYRLSAEALMRRIVQGKGLYKISNLVDIINLSSIQTGYSIGGYYFEKIVGSIILDIGNSEDEYFAIGRGKFNISELPVFRDDLGAFGSPTSDSQRTMISDKTNKILLVVFNFGGHAKFTEDVKSIENKLILYANASNIQTILS